MNPQEAGDAARYTHSGSSQPTGTVMTDGGRTQLEAGVCAGVREELIQRGHSLSSGANGGGYQSITCESLDDPVEILLRDVIARASFLPTVCFFHIKRR